MPCSAATKPKPTYAPTVAEKAKPRLVEAQKKLRDALFCLLFDWALAVKGVERVVFGARYCSRWLRLFVLLPRLGV